MNGWSNYLTWLVNLHFGDEMRDKVDSYGSINRGALEASIRARVMAWVDDIRDPFTRDLIITALGQIDFDELAATYNAG